MFNKYLNNAKIFFMNSNLKVCRQSKKLKKKLIKKMLQENYKELGEICKKIMNLIWIEITFSDAIYKLKKKKNILKTPKILLLN